MIPHERSLVEELAGRPFAIIGVNSDKDLENLQKLNAERQVTWRSFWNGPEGTRGPIAKEWNVSSWPTIYLIDAEGKIRYKNLRGNPLEDAIKKLVAETEAATK